jgi:hypothetical protein
VSGINFVAGRSVGQLCRRFSKFSGFEYGIEFNHHDFVRSTRMTLQQPSQANCGAEDRRRARRFGPALPSHAKNHEAGDRSGRTEGSAMTVHASRLLTPEEFASLIEVAVTTPDANIPPAHLSKLVSLGYVVLTDGGSKVTGDGLIRITESE